MNKNLNRKGFTLIELLAVIVILAILVMLAIPAVTKYLSAARQGAFSDNAHKAIDAVRTDVITTGFTTDNDKCTQSGDTMTCKYKLKTDINPLLEKKLESSPFGGGYVDDSYVLVIQTYHAATGTAGQEGYKPAETTYTYKMCLIDLAHNGFEETDEKDINSKAVLVGGAPAKCETDNSNNGGGENNGG